MKKGWIAALCLVGSLCHAESYALILHSLEKTHQGEAGGDELYIAVAEYGADGKDNLIEIPNFPLHWFSDALQEIQDEVIWQGSLIEGQSLSLEVELDERDFGIFGADDNIGSVRIALKQRDGTLSELWESRDGNGVQQESSIRGGIHQYDWRCGKAEYQIRLSVEEKA